jgi:hypothetical protein
MTDDLPPLSPHDHPDPQSFVWSRTEIEAIQNYARLAAQQARRQALEEAERILVRRADLIEAGRFTEGSGVAELRASGLMIRALMAQDKS